MVAGESVASVPPKIHETIDGQHADAAAVGENRETVAGKRPHVPECGRGGEQFVEVEHAKHAGAAERGIIDGIGAGQRSGVGSRRDGALRMTPGLDDDDRLDARGGAGRRHELAGIVDQLDVEQNGPRAAIDGEIVEQIAEIDIDLVAERDHRRESDRAFRGPFDQARGDGSGLRDQGEVAALRHARGKAGIELHRRNEDAEAVGADAGAGPMRGPRARRLRTASLDRDRGPR